MPHRIYYTSSPIGTLDALASTLSCEEKRLTYIADNISDFYDFFSTPKKNGQLRAINSPKRELKVLQKRINSRIFRNCVFPLYLQGSVKDSDNPRDFVSNANLHSRGKFFVLADIQDFFPSVKPKYVHDIFKYLFRFPDPVADLLVRLTTLDEALPQGAPTSSYLANLIFYNVEHKIVKDFAREGLVYSRLIDDISVSSRTELPEKRRRHILEKIRRMIGEKELQLHRGKVKLLNSGGCGIVVPITGLNIEKGAPRLPLEYRRKVNREVYYCFKSYDAGYGSSADYHEKHNSISGRVALMTRLNYAVSEKYRETLRYCLPFYDTRKCKKISALCNKFASKKGKDSDTVVYARKYHKYMYHLGILARNNPARARNLKSLLQKYKPKIKLNEVDEDLL